MQGSLSAVDKNDLSLESGEDLIRLMQGLPASIFSVAWQTHRFAVRQPIVMFISIPTAAQVLFGSVPNVTRHIQANVHSTLP